MEDKDQDLDKFSRNNPSPEQMLGLIFEYAAKIANEKNLDHLLGFMADLGREMVVADRCTLWLYDKDKNELWTKVAHGVNEIRMPANSGLVGYAINSGEPLFIEDAYKDSRFHSEVDKRTGYKTKAILVIPFKNNNGEIMGAYQAINKMTKEEKFSQQDQDYLILASSYAAKSLEAALLNYEIEETEKEIIFKMGEIGESRSRETGNHVRRVAEYSKVLAKAYGFSVEESELITMASPMHDIGKVAIPDSILKKPAKLTDEEFVIMKTHTEIGYNLLKNSKRKILKAAAIIAYEHHEKWNGKGYPRGLKGEEIHIYARITALADVFDALGSDRVYKKAWELEPIIDLFIKEKGEHFDPHLVDIFLNQLDELVRIRNMY